MRSFISVQYHTTRFEVFSQVSVLQLFPNFLAVSGIRVFGFVDVYVKEILGKEK